MGNDRSSRPGEAPPEPKLTPEETALLQAKNVLRQFDRLKELIDEAVKPKAKFRLRHSSIMELNRMAVYGLPGSPGYYRTVPMGIDESKHLPPPPDEVAGYMDEMCEYTNDNWDMSPLHLAAYTMWRLNWVHPFLDGNGRTARAVSYLVLSARLGYRIPGTKTIPERIAADKDRYYAALEAADAANADGGKIDVSAMEEILSGHLASQLQDIMSEAGAPRR